MATKTKVGVRQISNPTPQWMSKVSNFIIFLATAWGIFAPSITELTEAQRGDVTRWVLICSGLIKLATKFFGVNAVNPMVSVLLVMLLLTGCDTTKITRKPVDTANCLQVTISYEGSSHTTFVCDSTAKRKILEVVGKLQK